MPATTPIRLLEADPNAKGDLFTRLIGDFFNALGYETTRTNVNRTGREIDVIARHRVEQRRAIAECKATKDLVGGDALNKFYGALDLERQRMQDEPVTGYFVSLMGFRDTALEQELEAAAQRFVLIDGATMATELVQGGTLVSERDAAAQACGMPDRPEAIKLLDRSELVGCRLGWLWCVYFGAVEQAPTHVAIVHASGSVLPQHLAAEVVACDQALGGDLHQLHLLAPPALTDDGDPEGSGEAITAYNAYLRQEFGFITLEGLPADQELGASRIDLDDLFVPVSLEPHEHEKSQDGTTEAEEEEEEEETDLTFEEEEEETDLTFEEEDPVQHFAVDDVLSTHRQVSILATPGGGKSTLLKHLATQHCDALDQASRGELGVGGMPFPVVIRCRQLTHPNTPIAEALRELPDRGEFPHLTAPFQRLLEAALLDGRLTVLVDGLDEIADDRSRVAFAARLRTFASMYPEVQLVVTSRPSGYRVVAGVLASVCTPYAISELSDDDIYALTRKWHRAVVGPSEQVQQEASALAGRIVATDRVRQLATNPLLLTTLLLVKRWVGDLPRKRSVLYQRAIEVLLMTWNVEGHDPIEPDEAVPQLAYVAYEMTAAGEQTITEPRLATLLRDARSAMPDILGYTKVGVTDFIRRIEERSSVLSRVGHVELGGRLVAQYEFKHLTFQEYLTALAVADSFCVPRLNDATLVETLDDRFGRPDWNEVIPLAGVLAERDASGLVRRLIAGCQQYPPRPYRRSRNDWAPELLARCLGDEVKITPELAREALVEIGPRVHWGNTERYIRPLLESRFGAMLRDLVSDALESGGQPLAAMGSMSSRVACLDFGVPGYASDPKSGDWAVGVDAALDSANWVDQARGCLTVMYLAWAASQPQRLRSELAPSSWLEAKAEPMLAHMASDREATSYAAAWALAWLGNGQHLPVDLQVCVLKESAALWQTDGLTNEHRRMTAWAFSAVPLMDRDLPDLGPVTDALRAFVEREAVHQPEDENTSARARAALILAYYLRAPWTDSTLLSLIRESENHHPIFRRIAAVLERTEAA